MDARAPIPQGIAPDWSPERFHAACEGKERHASEGAARAALGYYQRRRTFRAECGMEPYLCEFCLDWHLGHAPLAPSRKKSQKAPRRKMPQGRAGGLGG